MFNDFTLKKIVGHFNHTEIENSKNLEEKNMKLLMKKLRNKFGELEA